MRRIFSLLIFAAAGAFAPGLAQADTGFYIGSDIGGNFANGVDFEGASNDGASHCDGYLNPGLSGCDDQSIPASFIPDWNSIFDGGEGILFGVTVGYSLSDQYPSSFLRGFRPELEYFYRESKYDQTIKIGSASGTTLDKINRGEFDRGPHERLGSITSHNLFGNLFYDFINKSRFTPYVGLGGGVGFTEADWSSNWTRTLDKDNLRDGLRHDGRSDLADSDVYIQNLAGSSSIAHTMLEDTIYGFQVLFGLDYAFTEALSVGLKGRWVKYGSFSDNLAWDPLRSHAPYNRVDAGGNPSGPMIEGSMTTSDIEFFGISVGLKYHF